jgi:hypothetical protein
VGSPSAGRRSDLAARAELEGQSSRFKVRSPTSSPRNLEPSTRRTTGSTASGRSPASSSPLSCIPRSIFEDRTQRKRALTAQPLASGADSRQLTA